MKLHVKIFSDLLTRKIFLTGTILVLSCFSLLSQEYITKVSNAMKQGDADAMSSYFDNTIDLTFSDKTNTYNKNQAVVIILKFFNKIEPKDYKAQQRGTSYTNNTKFNIGTLYTSNGVYKVYMLYIVKKGQYVLKELRFEK